MSVGGIDRWKSRLAGQVFDRLREDIIRGVLPPGAHLAEQDLSETMQVSRTPVREALIKLVEEGLVQTYPQLGSFVAPISPEAVREGQYVREHLECAMVVDAARRMTPEAEQQIRDNIARQKYAERLGDAEEFYRLDNAFHALLAELSGHPTVWQLISQVKTHIDRVRYHSVHEPEQLPKLILQHEAIADALGDGDVKQAQEILRHHLREVLATIDKMDDEAPVPAKPPRRRRISAKQSK